MALKPMCAIITDTIKAVAIITTISGLSFNPSPSSSKNLNNPAVVAGIGDSFLRLLLIQFSYSLRTRNKLFYKMKLQRKL